jgi:hypothetical protein
MSDRDIARQAFIGPGRLIDPEAFAELCARGLCEKGWNRKRVFAVLDKGEQDESKPIGT